MVGTRSAMFTPLPEAGLIVIDEEHDGSYKQQDGIRYHARDVALVRAKALGDPGAAGQRHAVAGIAAQRADGPIRPAAPAAARRRGAAAAGARGRRAQAPARHGLSQDVLDASGACLARGEQALVFKNRRGYAPVLLCHDCGWSAQVPALRRAMTVHGAGRTLICHHCGARQRAAVLPRLRQPGAAAAGFRHRATGRSAGRTLSRRGAGAHRSRHDARRGALEKHLKRIW
jgi:primosomal protein N' (replication factor Y)